MIRKTRLVGEWCWRLLAIANKNWSQRGFAKKKKPFAIVLVTSRLMESPKISREDANKFKYMLSSSCETEEYDINHRPFAYKVNVLCFSLATRSCQEASEPVWLRSKLSEKWVMGGTKQKFIASEVFQEFRHHWSSHPDSHTEVILHGWWLLTYLTVWQQLQPLTPEAHY